MRSVRRTLRVAGILGCAGLLMIGGGCVLALLDLVPAAEEIPPELAIMLDDTAQYCGDPNDLLEVPTGVVPVTDISILDGCWGTCWQTTTAIPNMTLDVFQTLKFDSVNARLERFIYQSIVMVPPFVDVQIGTLTLGEYGAATFEVSQILSTTQTGRLTDITDKYDTLPLYEVQLDMASQQLMADFDEIDTPRTSGGFADCQWLRHTRFDCP